MTPERMRLLDSIGFRWPEPRGEALWNRHFSELVEYKNMVRSQQQHLQLPHAPIYSTLLHPFCILSKTSHAFYGVFMLLVLSPDGTLQFPDQAEREREYWCGSSLRLVISFCNDADTHAFEIIINSSISCSLSISLALSWQLLGDGLQPSETTKRRDG